MASTLTLLASQTITTNTTSSTLPNSSATPTIVAYLNVTAASGTSPTLTVTLQDSPDGVNWYNIPSGGFSAVSAVGTSRLALPAGTVVGPNFRASVTVGGTTPSFTASLIIQFVG